MGLLRELALWRSRLIGLDIGTAAIKAARIRRRSGRIVVTRIARTEIEPVSPDRPAAEENVAMAVSRCLQVLHGRTSAVCSLSGLDVAVRTFEFPSLPRHQLASAVELEAAQVCPFEVNEAAVAYHVLRGLPQGRRRPAEGQRIVGFFTAARNKTVQQRRALCERSRTPCAMLDVDGLALLNCLDACGLRKDGEAAMILNIGHSCTNLAIVSEDGLPFVRDISYAGDHILTRISEIQRMSRQAVIDALKGCAASGAPRAKFQSAVHQACASLMDRVTDTLRYYGTHRSGPAVDRVFLCGGFSQFGPAVEAMISLLPAEAQLWDAPAVLPCTRSVRRDLAAEHGPAFAVALGLALRTLRDVHD